ncbi:MAG: glycosyltransferase family 4 protein [Planctomycetes bacterium]|nr:glycosyltransferase family 4 protein [Planctomycetota bacterium]
MIGNEGNTSRPPKNWLCIAYAFPPIQRSGVHRTLGFVRHLSKRGWNATVLTVNPGDEPIDKASLELVPDSVDVIRTPWHDLIAQTKRLLRMGSGAMPEDAPISEFGVTESRDALRTMPRRFRDWVSRLMTTPDSRLGWYWPACRAGKSILQSRRYDVIYSTSPYMTAHLIARRLSQRSGIPWVADFRDPWRDNPFREQPFSSLNRWDAFLERGVLRQADYMVCNTPTMRARLCERLPFVAEKSTVIMNGFDRDWLVDVKPNRPGPANEFILTHAGQFYGRRSPIPLFRALRRAMASPSITGRRIRLTLIGPGQYDGVSLEELARMEGVENHVTIISPKPHREALSLLAGSDAVLLMGSSGPGSDLQIPNKLFEYLALRRPILAVVAPANPSVEVLDTAQADAIVCDPQQPDSLTNALARLMHSSILCSTRPLWRPLMNRGISPGNQHATSENHEAPLSANCEAPPPSPLPKGGPRGVLRATETATAIALVEPPTNNQPQPNGAWRGVNQFDRTHRAAELATIFDLVSQTPPHEAMARGIECQSTVNLERDDPVMGRAPADKS